MAKFKKNYSVLSPNLGIYIDRPPITLSPRMLQDGLNFRIKEGKLTNIDIGWLRFGTFILNGPVLLIEDFFIKGVIEQLIFATKTDLYRYNNGTPQFITPIYTTGTASSDTFGAVTGTGTAWLTNTNVGNEISFGVAPQNDPTATWYLIVNINADNSMGITNINGGTYTGGVQANGPYTIRRKFSGTEADIWVADVFPQASPSNKDEWWATNGVDYPVRWDGISPNAELMSSLGFTCKTLKVFSNMMCFMNLVQAGTSKGTDLINSNPGEPQNVSSGLSEQFKIHSGQDQILGSKLLGDSLIIYSSNTITVTQFVGDPLVFIFRNAVIGQGPLAAKAIVQFPDYHLFLGRDSEYNFDGASAKRIGLNVWRDILPLRDPIRTFRTYAHKNEFDGEVMWVMPRSTDAGGGTINAPPALATTEHYLEQVGDKVSTPMSIRDFPFTSTGTFNFAQGVTWNQLVNTWASYPVRWSTLIGSVAFGVTLVGDQNGKVYTLNVTSDADGSGLRSFVKFGRRPLSDGKMRGLIRRVYPYVTPQSTNLNLVVHLADFAHGPSTINAFFPYDQTLPEGVFMIPVYRRGRYLELEFGTVGPAQPWELEGYDMDIITGGER